MVKNSSTFRKIYTQLLEQCNIQHVKYLYVLGAYGIQQKIKYFKKYFPNLNRQVNDHVLASFLGISREYLVKNKSLF